MDSDAPADPAQDARSMPLPNGVDSQVWQDLGEALSIAISRYSSAATAGDPPGTDKSKVADLHVTLADGAPTFTWSFRNYGDYDQNGQVNISDLTPVGVNFKKRSSDPGWSSAQLADGDANGEVNISDVSPIGAGLGAVINGYMLEASNDPQTESSWASAGHIAITFGQEPLGGGALQFTLGLTDLSAGDYYRVRPYVGDPDVSPHLGVPSDALFASATPPPTVLASRGDFPDKVVISWTSMPLAQQYEVYRDAGTTPIGTTAATTIDDTTVGDFLTHDYRVKAVYPGVTSDYSLPAQGYRAQRGQWWAFGQGAMRNRRALAAGPATNQIRWAIRDDAVYERSSPVVAADGTVYIGNALVPSAGLMAFTASGDRSWRYPCSPVHSSPAIGSDGTIYFGDDQGQVYALNPDSTRQWNYATGDAIESSPLLDDAGNVFFGSLDSSIYALDRAGKHLWDASEMDEAHASPALALDGTVAMGGDGGRLNTYVAATGAQILNVQVGRIRGAVMTAPEGGFICANNSGYLFSLAADGSENWNYKISDEALSSPALQADGAIVFGSGDGNLYCYNPNGTSRWAYPFGAPVSASPAIDGSGNIYDADESGHIVSVDQDGNLRWEFTAEGAITSSPAFDNNGYLYLADATGLLYCFGPEAPVAPKPMTNVMASDGAAPDSITVTWDKAYNADGYNIYKDGNGTPFATAAATDLQWIDTTVLDIDPHTYRVAAFNEFGEGTSGQDDGNISGVPAGPGEWDMPNQDPAGSRRSTTNGPRTNNVAWSYPTGHPGSFGPVIGSAGELYFCVQDAGIVPGKLISLTAGGELRWEFPVNDGPSAMPAIGDDGTLYFGTNDNTLYAVRSSGTERWHIGIPGATGPITIDSDKLYFCVSGDNDTDCRNASDGSVVWIYPRGNYRTVPALGSDGTMYVSNWGSNHMDVVKPDGNAKPYTLGGVDVIEGSPAVLRDAVNGDKIYFGSGDSLFCWRADGSPVYRFQVSGINAASGIALMPNGTAIVGMNAKLYMVSPGGSEVWSQPGYAGSLSRVCIDVSGYSYATLGTSAFCIRPDGSLQWNFDMGKDTDSSWPVLGPEGTYYVLTDDGTLNAFAAN